MPACAVQKYSRVDSSKVLSVLGNGRAGHNQQSWRSTIAAAVVERLGAVDIPERCYTDRHTFTARRCISPICCSFREGTIRFACSVKTGAPFDQRGATIDVLDNTPCASPGIERRSCRQCCPDVPVGVGRNGHPIGSGLQHAARRREFRADVPAIDRPMLHAWWRQQCR